MFSPYNDDDYFFYFNVNTNDNDDDDYDDDDGDDVDIADDTKVSFLSLFNPPRKCLKSDDSCEPLRCPAPCFLAPLRRTSKRDLTISGAAKSRPPPNVVRPGLSWPIGGCLFEGSYELMDMTKP
jgi:hypothetical protein